MRATAQLNEDELCSIFAERVLLDKEFAKWLLSQTKFANATVPFRLLYEEQNKRPAKAWWRHWWCKIVENGRESETDIFLVFEVSGKRIALHIENKITAPLTAYQAGDYALRARQMRTNKWVPYADFQTIIIAPSVYITRNLKQCCEFDLSISYEDLGKQIDEFLIVASRLGGERTKIDK